MRKLLILIIAVAGLLLVAPPAGATNETRTYPWIMPGWSVTQLDRDRGQLNAVIQGPRNIWGMRDTAKNIDKRVYDMRIHHRRGIRCSDIPNHSLCITVKRVYRPNTKWAGQAWIPNSQEPYNRTILLNTAHRAWQPVAAHELGHAFAIGHHLQKGSVYNGSYPWEKMTKYLSKTEIRLIRKQF